MLPHRCHGDHHPIEGRRDGSEPRVFVDLDEEAEAGENEAADDDKEDEEAELPVTLSQGVHDRLESGKYLADE